MESQARPRAVQPDTIGSHRPADVLHPLLADEVQDQVELALKLVISRAGDQNPARLAQLLQPGRHVDALAEEVLPLDHDVAKIDADAKHDPVPGRHIGLPLRCALLHADRAGHSVDHRAELGNGPVAHQLDDSTVVHRQQRFDDLASQVLQRRQGTSLILLDEVGIADDIRRQDCRKPPLDPCCCHSRLSLERYAG